ncbi:MAG: hypothetical protein ACOC7R_00625, partial [Planctomycetota bacterium]
PVAQPPVGASAPGPGGPAAAGGGQAILAPGAGRATGRCLLELLRFRLLIAPGVMTGVWLVVSVVTALLGMILPALHGGLWALAAVLPVFLALVGERVLFEQFLLPMKIQQATTAILRLLGLAPGRAGAATGPSVMREILDLLVMRTMATPYLAQVVWPVGCLVILLIPSWSLPLPGARVFLVDLLYRGVALIVWRVVCEVATSLFVLAGTLSQSTRPLRTARPGWSVGGFFLFHCTIAPAVLRYVIWPLGLLGAGAVGAATSWWLAPVALIVWRLVCEALLVPHGLYEGYHATETAFRARFGATPEKAGRGIRPLFFRLLVLPWVVRIGWVVGCLGIVAAAVAVVAGPLGGGNIALTVSIAALGTLVALVLWRVLCENAVVVFNIEHAVESLTAGIMRVRGLELRPHRGTAGDFFAFRRMLAPLLIQILWVLAAAVLTVAFLYGVFRVVAGPVRLEGVMVLLSVIAGGFGWRIVFEASIIGFTVNRLLTAARHALMAVAPPAQPRAGRPGVAATSAGD